MDWLPEGHLVYFVIDAVDAFDLTPIYRHYEREVRGAPPFNPQMMVTLLLYAYSVGVFSSRRIERATQEDVAFRVLTGGVQPDHSAIAEFRRVHLGALQELFGQVLRMCRKAGLVKLGQVAIDGTKVKANASKHKAMSYARMKEQEKDLAKQIRELMERAERADAEEDARFGKKARGDELPEELQRRELRLQKIREARRALEEEAKAQAKQDEDDDPPRGGGADDATLPLHRHKRTAEGKPGPKAQRNFTDPESRIQKTNQGFEQGYNCQAAVDGAHQIIVAAGVTNQSPDAEMLVPMVAQVIANAGAVPQVVLADTGYFGAENIAKVEATGVEALVSAGRRKHGDRPQSPRGRAPSDLTPKERMARKLATKRPAMLYALRKQIVEPVFGQVKAARGFRQFLLRGLKKVSGEWSLLCATHNLLKLWRSVGAVPA